MTAAITITAVDKHYPRVRALDGIDLTIEQGEFFGLLGPNGAGKSTLINIIAGLTRASRGQVAVLGHDVVSDYRAARRLIGIVPQELVFDPFFTVREVLQIQAGYFGLGRAIDPWIDEVLEALKLSDKANSNMRSLSGGMKRRVLIAQALVHQPQVVVLDEPTAGVDVELRRLLWEFVSGLHRRGHTIVLTTHYLEEAERLCDRIAILNHGRLIALDSKQALLQRELGNTLRLLVMTRSAVDSLPPSLAALIRRHDGDCLELELPRTLDAIITALDALRTAGVVISDLQTRHADLEDVFMALTQQDGGV
ncbi:MAG: ABC transporter ATP-binding protein [Gammaproteobacteria bacterium]|nr:ABC transporter ATP-binding protein [Gammaproteobacteria bacterium]